MAKTTGGKKATGKADGADQKGHSGQVCFFHQDNVFSHVSPGRKENRGRHCSGCAGAGSQNTGCRQT